MRKAFLEQQGHPIILTQLAEISPRAARELPRDLLNCILGTTAVHLAVRNPDDPAIVRLALEVKVGLFEGINNAFQQPQHQRADVLFVCITLMFAMDVRNPLDLLLRVLTIIGSLLIALQIIEHGLNRWSTHFLGAIKLLRVSGSLERFGSHYPHMVDQLAGVTQVHTMSVMISSMAVDCPKLVSRHDLGACFDPRTRKRYFTPCPQRLFYSLYDMAECSRNIVQTHDYPSDADVYTREWILWDVLRYSPDDDVKEMRDINFGGRVV
jgi:hypothetical protein